MCATFSFAAAIVIIIVVILPFMIECSSFLLRVETRSIFLNWLNAPTRGFSPRVSAFDVQKRLPLSGKIVFRNSQISRLD